MLSLGLSHAQLVGHGTDPLLTCSEKMPLSPKFKSQGADSLQVERLCVSHELGNFSVDLPQLVFVFTTFVTLAMPAKVVIHLIVIFGAQLYMPGTVHTKLSELGQVVSIRDPLL